MNYEQFDDFTLAMADLTADTIRQVVLIADANDKDRDSALGNFAKVVTEMSDKYSLDCYDPNSPMHHLSSKN